MNIGVFFKHPRSGGGVYQYFLSVMESLIRLKNQDQIFLYYCHTPEPIDSWQQAGVRTFQLSLPTDGITADSGSADKQLPRYKALHNGVPVYFRTKPYSAELRRLARRHGIDLMLYTNAERESFEAGIPFVSTVLDWTHKTHPHFREFVADGVPAQRDYVIDNIVRQAIATTVDSQAAKQEIITFFGGVADRTQVLPFIPPPYVCRPASAAAVSGVKQRYHLPERFIFYPAQFWPHKNHANIVRALAALKQLRGMNIPLVCVGSTESKWSSYPAVLKLAGELGIESQVIHPGYVPTADMVPLYRSATALVIPTFPGPTNLPILEGFATGCPVIASDIEAVREQTRGAALLIDPTDVDALAHAILNVWTNTDLCNGLVARGKQRIDAWGANEFGLRLEQILNQARSNIGATNGISV